MSTSTRPPAFSLPWWSRLGLKISWSYGVVILVGASATYLAGRYFSDLLPFSPLEVGLLFGVTGAIIASIGTTIFVASQIVRPLRAIVRVTQRIVEGHYNERAPIPSPKHLPDELGELAAHVNWMTEHLAQAEQRRRQFISDIAHELRTPLTNIKGYVEGLIDGVLPPTEETYWLICEEAQRMHRLIEDLQELSRIEEQALAIHPEPTPIQDLIQAAVRRMRPAFQEKGVRLKAELDQRLPLVAADGERILQVLGNLLSNALRYTPRGGRVTVAARPQGHEVLITVADTGIGIPAEDLPHIFQRFYRVDKSRSRAGGGTGLGLTIAKHLVEAHGGRIWAESPGPGQGSVFAFTLPVAEA